MLSPLSQSLSPLWTPPKVAAAASYAATVLADSPIGYWRLGETSGTVANDSSGNGHNGTYTGTWALAQPALIADTDTSAKAQPHAYIGIGSSASLDNLAAFSVEFWMLDPTFPTDTGFNGTFWSKSLTKEIDGASTFFGARQMKITINRATTSAQAVSADLSSIASSTMHLVFTWDGTTPKIFVNGSETVYTSQTSGSGAVSDDSANPMNLVASAFDDNSNVTTTYDEFAIYGSALSPTRIAAHYAAGI